MTGLRGDGWLDDSDGAGWVLASYKAPLNPSTARVAAWRGLRAIGGVFLGPTVCVVPAALADDGRLATIAERVTRAGGTFERYGIPAFAPDAEARCRRRYNAARDAEYAAVGDEAARLVRRLQQEASRGYAAVEDREIDFVKLRGAFRRVRRVDLFGAPGRPVAAAAVERAAAIFAALTTEATIGEGAASGQILGTGPFLGAGQPLEAASSS